MCDKWNGNLYTKDLTRRKVLLVKTLVEPEFMCRSRMRSAIDEEMGLLTVMGK